MEKIIIDNPTIIPVVIQESNRKIDNKFGAKPITIMKEKQINRIMMEKENAISLFKKINFIQFSSCKVFFFID